MGMHNTTNGGKSLVQQTMRRRIGRGLFLTFNHFTRRDADNHHIVNGHHAVIHAGRFNDKDAVVAIDGTDVPPGERDQVVLWQRQIRCQYLAFEIF